MCNVLPHFTEFLQKLHNNIISFDPSSFHVAVFSASSCPFSSTRHNSRKTLIHFLRSREKIVIISGKCDTAVCIWLALLGIVMRDREKQLLIK